MPASERTQAINPPGVSISEDMAYTVSYSLEPWDYPPVYWEQLGESLLKSWEEICDPPDSGITLVWGS